MFRTLELVSAMRLSFTKVCFIPLSRPPSIAFEDEFRTFLSDTPDFMRAKTFFGLRYLSLIIGPRSRQEKWCEQVRTFLSRTDIICSMERASYVHIAAYQTLGITTLSCMLQL